MGSVDNRTFKVNFTSHGVAQLTERVKEKLNELMEDYTDDTLAEYVIVLLRNGRRKEEAKNELNVFLGDDSDSFVSWLWDHLASSLDLYVQQHEVHDGPQTKSVSGEKTRILNLDNLDAESEKVSHSSRRHHNKECKDLVEEGVDQPPLWSAALRSAVVCDFPLKKKVPLEVNCQERSSSPPCPVQRKRNRPDDLHSTKKEMVPHVNTGAPRRLLQFAVRDAVATSRPSNLTTPAEPKLKRLRSVVSTVSGDSFPVDSPQHILSSARSQNPLTTASNAVVEVPEDVKRVKYSRSVFDRLGRPTDSLQTNDELEEKNQNQEQIKPKHFQSVYSDVIAMENRASYASAFKSDEGFEDIHIMGHNMNGARKDEESLMVPYDVWKDNNSMLLQQSRHISHQAMVPKNSGKIGNVAAKMNTWKQASYQESHNSLKDSQFGPIGSSLQTVKGTDAMKIMNGNDKPVADTKKDLPKTQPSNTGLVPAGRLLEDADSRTIFVSNVHFAATKDSLSRHFNRFGEVLKVIILTDVATGQPKGAAYVDFTCKDAADNALSLDGTYFMSRIIKVVKKSAAAQESSQIPTWPRFTRALVSTPGLGRVPFSRGSPNAYRPWSPLKPVARSMQWKRESQCVPADSAAAASTSMNPAPATRSLTYVRTEVKQGSSGNT